MTHPTIQVTRVYVLKVVEQQQAQHFLGVLLYNQNREFRCMYERFIHIFVVIELVIQSDRDSHS